MEEKGSVREISMRESRCRYGPQLTANGTAWVQLPVISLSLK